MSQWISLAMSVGMSHDKFSILSLKFMERRKCAEQSVYKSQSDMRESSSCSAWKEVYGGEDRRKNTRK